MLRTVTSAMIFGTLAVGCGGGTDGASLPMISRSVTDTAAAGDSSPPAPSSSAEGENTAAGPGSPGAPAIPTPPVTPPHPHIGPVTPEERAVVDAALADAERRTGLASSALVVVSVQAVVWADGSLGCPQPGMAYTMALVPGHRVRIRAGDDLLDYHAGGRQLILCPPERATDPLPVESS